MGRGVLLGLLLGASVLTRHVGIGLALAVGLDLLWKRRPGTALVAWGIAGLMALPWVGWLASVRHNTQIGLLPRSGLPGRVAENALFYLRRIPDQITGPIVEVGTVFRPALRGAVTLWALAATGVVVVGWVRTLRTGRRRLAGLVPLATLPLLLLWPFTEAGRFLVPLVPFLLVGAVEGLAAVGARLGWRRPRVVAARIVLAASIPYAVYAIATHRAEAARRTHADFDAACAWIARQADRPGPVLTRHPGEVYWQTGRNALAPEESDTEAIGRLIERYGVAYLLVDEERYARAPENPLSRFVADHPGRVARAWDAKESVSVYSVVRSSGAGWR